MKLHIPDELFNIREFICSLESMTDMTYDIKRLRLKLPEGETINFKAGQFMQFYTKPYGKVKEGFWAYSISQRPASMTVPGTADPSGARRHLHHLCAHGPQGRGPGSPLRPYGDFYLRGNCEELIMIAGGSGLAPIRSLVYDVIEKGLPYKMRSSLAPIPPVTSTT